MKFLDYLFHGKELRYIDSYFKMLNGYSPTFTSYNGGVYEMDLTRTAVNSFATHCSKLKPEIEGSALKSLEKTLQHKPNYFMDTTKFIKRLATYVAVEHTAFIIPIEDEYGRLCGWYPLRAQRCEVVEAAGQVYLRYLFANGEHGAIEFERVGIMTDFEYTDDLFGEDNRTLKPTMQLIHLLQQERKITCGKQTLWEQRKAQRLKRGLQQCRKRQQQWKVYKTGKERGVAWAAP